LQIFELDWNHKDYDEVEEVVYRADKQTKEAAKRLMTYRWNYTTLA